MTGEATSTPREHTKKSTAWNVKKTPARWIGLSLRGAFANVSRRTWLRIIVCTFLCAAAWAQSPFNPKSAILNSKHDFRATSTSAVRSVSGSDPCVFCHTPHNGTPGPEIWNHTMGSTSFPTYSSTTMQSPTGQMMETDSSKMCLSCHDGTIALASTVNNGDIELLQGPDYKFPSASTSNLIGDGTKGFSDDHPFAFVPILTNSEIQLPPPGDAVMLENGKVQCVSCHDPHKEDIDTTQRKFLVKVNQGSALCRTCHLKNGWAESSHGAPADLVNDAKYSSVQGAHTGYTGVAANGCESCHLPHTADSKARLVKFTEEETCFKCHDGSVATYDMQADIQSKTYSHPVTATPSVHDAAEGLLGSANPLPETSPSTPRHAECEDCHNPHQARPALPVNQSLPPGITPPLTGVSGLSAPNSFLTMAVNQYEICFKCHADSANRPQLGSVGSIGGGYGRNPQRQFDAGNPDAFNTRVEFSQSTSAHPVMGGGGSSLSVSLRPYMLAADGTDITTRPLNGASMIFCTDCHASDSNRSLGAGNSGPLGPHGSNYQHLLERRYVLEEPPATPGSSGNPVGYASGYYALCYKCHDEQSIRSDASFKDHNQHLKLTSCGTCHDPHASRAPRLINFDLNIVGPSSSGGLNYLQTSPGHGSCTLRCHGENHNQETY